MYTLKGSSNRRIDLVCGVSTLPALRSAVDHGASTVSFGINAADSAQPSAANLSIDEAARGMRYAHGNRVRTVVTLDVFPQERSVASCRRLIDAGADLGAD